MKDLLSPTMQRAVRLAMDSGGKLIRYPGGYWRGGGAGHVGTSTVEALVKRGVGSYSAWKESRRGKFPIELTLTPHWQTNVEPQP